MSLCPFSWYGGKNSHLTWLLPVINETPHVSYVESFGGSAAVLLNKNPSLIETYNDIYSDVVHFFKTLRTRKEELITAIQLTSFSREEFSNACLNPSDDELERARQFFIKARQVRSGLVSCASPGRWGYVKTESRRKMAMSVSRWLTGIDTLDEVCERLKLVQIENLDGLDLIQRYDTPDCLHYIDPPYTMNERSGGVGYAHEFDKHQELLDLIKTLKGKVIISGYDNELYNLALKDWNKHYQKEKSTAAAAQSKKNKIRQEIIWKNY